MKRSHAIGLGALEALVVVAWVVQARSRADLALAAAHAAQGSRVLETRLGPIEVQQAGLIDDTRLGKRLAPYPLEAIRAPTLAISARDDGFGTYDGARYVASRVPGARFIGYDSGGHLLAGHDDETRRTIVDWLSQAVSSGADGMRDTRS
jgi:2-hydroxy-6-oxonona-2,4-dienedioate hydrolase